MEAVGGALVGRQRKREGGSCRSRRLVGKVQGGSGGSVQLGAWGAAPAAAAGGGNGKSRKKEAKVKPGTISQI